MAAATRAANPLEPVLQRQPVILLDGGLASELESRGCDLGDELWSARMLLDRPELVRQVHLEYLQAGADCLISASYQATLEGFARHGLEEGQAAALLRRSVALCREARDAFWKDAERRQGRVWPLIAASVGPYGASLADGSEFRGHYDLDEPGLLSFHHRRWQVLASAGADLLACETLPCRAEARALRRLLEGSPGVHAWFSFSCRDGRHLSDGTPLTEVVAELESCPEVVAVGVNCTAPRHIASLVSEARSRTSKPIVVYPNSGEIWEAASRRWLPAASEEPTLAAGAPTWIRLGATLIGGCCRTTPADIAALRRAVLA